MPSENDEKTETMHNSRLQQQEIGLLDLCVSSKEWENSLREDQNCLL